MHTTDDGFGDINTCPHSMPGENSIIIVGGANQAQWALTQGKCVSKSAHIV